MSEYSKSKIPFERVIFFTDAVVAIAITLLALELKLNVPESQHLTFSDLASPWHQYLAFLLSFINIAGFWHAHRKSFSYIKKIDEIVLFLNIVWLFFVVTIPFATSVLSSHFSDSPAVLLYSANVFFISVAQNFIWDYADSKPGFVNRENLNREYQTALRWMLNLDMLNGLIAIAVSFFMPMTAFFLMFFKIPIIVFLPLLSRGKGANKR